MEKVRAKKADLKVGFSKHQQRYSLLHCILGPGDSASGGTIYS